MGGAIPHQRRILTDNEIYLSSANQFNDPFDSSVPFQYSKRAFTKRNIYKRMLFLAKREYPTLSDDRLKKMCKERLESDFYKDKNYAKEFNEGFVKTVSEEIGVFSLSKDNNNLLMWSHYADSHRGYCIGFDHKMLLELSGSLGSVLYRKKFPRISVNPKNEALDFLKLFRTKSKEWEYENEYRIILPKKARKILKYHDECIKEIILGCNIQDKDKKDIIKIAKQKNSNIKFFETKRNSEKYELIIKELNNSR